MFWDCLEMSVTNCQSALPNIPEGRISQLLPGGSLISRLKNNALMWRTCWFVRPSVTACHRLDLSSLILKISIGVLCQSR